MHKHITCPALNDRNTTTKVVHDLIAALKRKSNLLDQEQKYNLELLSKIVCSSMVKYTQNDSPFGSDEEPMPVLRAPSPRVAAPRVGLAGTTPSIYVSTVSVPV